MKDTKKSRRVFVAAPDRATTGYLFGVIAQHTDLEVETTLLKKSAEIRRVLSSKKDMPLCAVLVPSDDHGPWEIEMIRLFAGEGVPCLIWDASDGDEDRAGWLTARLAEQAGAKTHRDATVITEAVRLLGYFNGPPDDGLVLNGRRASVVGTRVTQALLSKGLKIKRSVRARPNTGFLSLGDKGRIVISQADRSPLDISAFETTFTAMGLFISSAAACSTNEAPQINIDRDAVSFIVKPPPRVLSEVTSKRLLACYGFGMPREQLCSSQSEAVRVASDLKGPVVLKLVRPEFSSRSHLEAISKNVVGQAAVKREFNRLVLFSEKLGTPKALGVLVSERVEPRASIRVYLKDHESFGRLLLLKRPDAETAGVLSIPCSYADVQGAVLRTVGNVASDLVSELSREVYRLSVCAADLAAGIDRLEIDPLVVVKADDGSYKTFAMDATIGIAEQFIF